MAGYAPALLDTLLYTDRAFFDYGGVVRVIPMEELPYWRTIMRRRGAEPRYAAIAANHAALLDEVRAAIAARGPLGNRDFAGEARVRSYRARKDSGLALYYLWLTGALMTHSRRGFERLYDLRERVAPPAHDHAAPEAEADAFFARQAAAAAGLWTERAWKRRWAGRIARPVDRAEAQATFAALRESLTPLRVEGHKEALRMPGRRRPLLDALAAGRAPRPWRSHGAPASDEAVFLAPLDPVMDRDQARAFFDFEYLWEVYKPAARRRWGYYTLPVLYGDRLVARLDPQVDRAAATLRILGFWPESGLAPDNAAFGAALARGLAAFAAFHDAQAVDLSAIPAPWREPLQGALDALEPQVGSRARGGRDSARWAEEMSRRGPGRPGGCALGPPHRMARTSAALTLASGWRSPRRCPGGPPPCRSTARPITAMAQSYSSANCR